MLAVEPLGSQYSCLFAWHEVGTHSHLGVDTLPSQRVPQKILKKVSPYTILASMIIIGQKSSKYPFFLDLRNGPNALI